MLSKTKSSPQISFFSTLAEQLNQQHPLCYLAGKIHWQVFEDSFSKYYSSKMGAPSKPIRLMVSLLILKQLRNLSDENIVEQWSENLYYQYFSGEQYFKPTHPCSATELVEFRKRIGVEGVELIFKESIKANGKDADEDTLSGDTTIQEKNITYPTDTKLHKKMINKCVGIAKLEGIQLKQSYKFTMKKLSVLLRFQHTQKGSKAARKARKRIKTIAGILVRELTRKLDSKALQKHEEQLSIYKKVILQKRTDKNKIYSLHETAVRCYTKGKEHKRFEFGSKAAILVTQNSNVIVGAISFAENIHDSKTLPQAIEQYEKLNDKKPKEILVDRGYPGKTEINGVKISMPKPQQNISKTQRKKHSRRAAIEPIFGHLKSDYRLMRNFLKGTVGDAINLLMSAAAMNFKRVMNLWLTEAKNCWLLIYQFFVNIYWKNYIQYPNNTF
jgi:transposase, IS5 family